MRSKFHDDFMILLFVMIDATKELVVRASKPAGSDQRCEGAGRQCVHGQDPGNQATVTQCDCDIRQSASTKNQVKKMIVLQLG
jgi:hypothetical protein